MRNLRFALIPAVLFLLPGLATPLFSQWGPTRIIKSAPDSQIVTSGNEYERVIAADSFSRVHVVWAQSDANHPESSKVYYQRSTDEGNTWEQSFQFSGEVGGNPCIATDGLNGVHVVWWGEGQTVWGLFYRRSLDGGATWAPETVLVGVPPYGESPASPRIVADEQGNVHLSWSNWFPDNHSEAAYKHSTDGGKTWGSDTLLTNTPLDVEPVTMGLDPKGNPHIAWDEYDPFGWSGSIIWYRNSSDKGLTWNPTMMIADSGATLPAYNNIAVDGLNRVYVFFSAILDSERQIVYRVSKDGGLTFGPRQALTPSAPGSEDVSVTGDVKGGVHVAYQYFNNGNWTLLYNGSTDGGVTWHYNPPFNLTDTFQGGWPSLTSDPTGRVHLVYRSSTSNPTFTSLIIYRSGYPLGVEENSQGDKETRGQVEKLRAIPNPFTSFVTVPGHEGKRFDLYDVMGRKVGTYKGDRIGEGLAAGVYFIRPEEGSLKPLRIVKLR